MQVSLLVYACSETLKLLCSKENSDIIFKVMTLEIVPPSFFCVQAQQQQPDFQAPIERATQSLQLCPVACWASCSKRHPPAWQTLMSCFQLQQKVPRLSFPKATRPSSSLPWSHNMSRTRTVTCVVGDAGSKPSTSVLTLLRLLITGLTVLLTADSLLCLL